MAVLLSEKDRARVGTTLALGPETVSRREIRRYAVATRQQAARYLQGDEAPPLFFTRFFQDIPSLDDLQHNGQPLDPLTHGLPLKRQMAGGSQVTFHRPIVAGDELRATRTLTALSEKQGRSGPVIFCTIALHVTDAAGRPVVDEVHTRILR